jgi:3-dehydroquinate dehydratase-2
MTRRSQKILKILIASGVNLDLLGRRQTDIYGVDTLSDMKILVEDALRTWARDQIGLKIKLVFFQTNSEDGFLREISKDYAGAVINAGAWTHTSLAIADRLMGVSLPYVEVHVSDVKNRESFRKKSYLSEHAIASVSGLGIKSYARGLEALLNHLVKKPTTNRRKNAAR